MNQPSVQCKHCGWIHFAVTRKYAEDEVKRFNEFFEQQTQQVKDMYGGKPSSVKNYENCGLCNRKADMIKPTKELRGSTIGPIIWEPNDTRK